mgnify:CR=1 FL=1
MNCQLRNCNIFWVSLNYTFLVVALWLKVCFYLLMMLWLFFMAFNVPGFAKVWHLPFLKLGTGVRFYFKVEVKYLARIYSVKLITKVWLFTFVDVLIRLPHFCKTLCYMPYFFASLLCFLKCLLEADFYLF